MHVEVSGYVGASTASIRWCGQLLWLRWKFLGVKGSRRGEEVERICTNIAQILRWVCLKMIEHRVSDVFGILQHGRGIGWFYSQ